MLTSGFFNSRNHDRLYDAIQFGSIFDGVIRDGIFMSIGDCFRVTQNTGMRVLVGPGRAWFNHTWTLNDAILPIDLPQSEILLNRIDAVVLEVNNDSAVRANSIKVIKGTPATNPVNPTLLHTASVNQYPLAYIRVNQQVTSVRQADITNMIGTSETPYVTGILQTVNIDSLVAQWGDQWKVFFEGQQADMNAANAMWKNQWSSWFNAQTTEMRNTYLAWIAEWEAFRSAYENTMEETGRYWKELWETWFYAYVNDNSQDIADWKHQIETEFYEWFESLQDLLDGNVAANLANKVIELEEKVKDLEDFKELLVTKHMFYEPLLSRGYYLYEIILDSNRGDVLDSDLDPIESRNWLSEDILDSNGDTIEFRTVFSVN